MSYYIRNAFDKAMAAIDYGPFNGFGQSLVNTFWKGFTILNAIKNKHAPLEEVKISTLKGVWEKLSPILMDDFEGFKASVEKVNCRHDRNSKRTKIRSKT